ncbi:peroxisomal adenine nucleotide transporter 1 [Ceratobasidium sp. AG-Ba]|nr:peroxisomal adenine nucleotide transporter 1 [Ceratobasidium sp. AG-Ba]
MSYAAVPGANFNDSARPTESPDLHHPNDSMEEVDVGPAGLAYRYALLDSNPSRSHTSPLAQSIQDNQIQQSQPRGRLKRILRTIWLTAWLPLVASAYLAFCYVAATGVVPVRIYNVDRPSEHLFQIKAGVTTLSIIVITIALLPVKSLLDDIKSEEFFRRIRMAKEGIPVRAVNDVSIPSHGFVQSTFSIFRSEASRYFTGAVFSSLVVAAVSFLAPAALSVGIIFVDGEIIALRVGALSSNSVYQIGDTESGLNSAMYRVSTEAASMGWAQSALGTDLAFKPDSPRYVVPLPLDLTPQDIARWVTDVVVMQPACSWGVSKPPVTLVPDPRNATLYGSTLDFTLPSHGVGASVGSYTIIAEVVGGSHLFNLTTHDPPLQGTTAWILAQCTSCVDPYDEGDNSKLNFTGIPYQELPVFDDYSKTMRAYHVAILICEPRINIETKEVRMEGDGKIHVTEDGRTLARQWNLPAMQTRLLMSRALDSYTDNSGPDSDFGGIGKVAQVRLLFGPQGRASETKTLTPLPIDELAREYNLALQASMRAYLSGSLGSAIVPGRIQTSILIFTSSLPHVVVSTILFVLIALFVNMCYFRSKEEQFTLVSVATALARSDLPVLCQEVRQAGREQGLLSEVDAMAALQQRRVQLNVEKSGYALNLE